MPHNGGMVRSIPAVIATALLVGCGSSGAGELFDGDSGGAGRPNVTEDGGADKQPPPVHTGPVDAGAERVNPLEAGFLPEPTAAEAGPAETGPAPTEAAPPVCVPLPVASVCSGVLCGALSDGCGGYHVCGTCPDGFSCNVQGRGLCTRCEARVHDVRCRAYGLPVLVVEPCAARPLSSCHPLPGGPATTWCCPQVP